MLGQPWRWSRIVLVVGLSIAAGPSTAATNVEEPVAGDVAQDEPPSVTPPVDGAMPSRVISAIKLPKWLTLTIQGNGKAELSGTPGAHDAGDHEVVLQVSDGRATARQSFTINVERANRPPVFISTPTTKATTGMRYAYLIKTADPDDRPLSSQLPAGSDTSLANASLPARAMAILRNNCFSCHNETKRKGDLVLVTRETALAFPALVPGDVDQSRIVRVIQPDSDPHMPPKKQLSDDEMATLAAWIKDGALWAENALKTEPRLPEPTAIRENKAYRPVMALALSADGKRLAVGRGGRIYLHDVSDAKREATELDGFLGAVRSLTWSRDGAWLASGGYQRVVLWDAKTMQQAREMTGLNGQVTALAFSPDGSRLVAADGQATQDSTIHQWSMPDLEPKGKWLAHQDTVFDLEVSGDGKLLATAGADKLVKLWNLETHEELGKLEGHTGHVLSLAFRQDSSRLATGGTDRQLIVWNVQTREQTRTIGHGGDVTALTWTKEGDKIISVCDDGQVRVCADAKKSLERTFDTTNQVLYAVAAIDTNMIYAGSHNGVVYVWSGDGKMQGQLKE